MLSAVNQRVNGYYVCFLILVYLHINKIAYNQKPKSMQNQNVSSEFKTEIVVGVVLVALFVFVFVAQSSASLSAQTILSNLFFR